jgi:Tol biopolymer transport system component
MVRLTAASLGLMLLFTTLTIYVVFSQRRAFPISGQRIVFEMGHRDYGVYTVQPNSSFGENIRLIFNPQSSFEDRFVTGVDCAPDSRSLIFWYIFLYRFDLISQDLTRIVVGDGLSQQSVWSPDGTRIAYLDNLANGPSRDIFMVDTDGINKTQVTQNNELETSLTWAPDGRQIAFSYRKTSSPTRQHGLAIVDLASGISVTIHETETRVGDVSWSPDGSQIAFSMAEGSESYIYTIRPDGSHLKRLNGAASTNIMPRWSPDGSLISFSARDPDEPYQLYVMSADGSAPYLVFLGLPEEDVFNRCWLNQPG